MLYAVPLSVIVCLAIVGLTVVGVMYFYRRYGRRKVSYAPLSSEKRLEVLKEVLQGLGCNPTADPQKGGTLLKFKYQGGSFYLIVSGDSQSAEMVFPVFYVTGQEQLDKVRTLCNVFNSNLEGYKVFYHLDDSRDEIHVSDACPLFVTEDVENMRQRLTDIAGTSFNIRREFDEKMRQLCEKSEGIPDPESHDLKLRREFVMLRRHELRSQQPELPMRPNETQRLTLAPLLKTFCGWEEMHAEHLRIITDHIEEVSDERRIGDYDLSLPLIGDDGTGGLTFTATHAILELTLSILQPEYPKSPDKHKLLLELSAYGQAEGTLYVQATLVQLPPSAVESTCRTSEAARAAVKTFVIPFDTKSAHDRQVEFEYFLKDAQDKIREKRYQDLTPEQVAMVNCDRPEISYDLYWGNYHFERKSYYKALLHLENAWRRLNGKFSTLRKDERQTFYHLCYQVGLCCDELGLPVRAYYYLDAVLPLRRADYTAEYVNCLVQAKDSRAYPFITQLLEFFQHAGGGHSRPDDEAHKPFVNFLRRQQAYVLLESGQIDVAESKFRQMLEEPDNADFALTKLAYIQRLRQREERQHGGADAAKDEPSAPSAGKP